MMFRTLAIAMALTLAGLPARALVETPMLEAAVAAGTLPPVAERLPAEPLVVDLAARGREAGAHGGTLRTLVARARDVRLAVVYGYARLVGYDESYALTPDILRDIAVEEGRVFTLTLREGHRWSDGAPFTAEDFRYWWEDVALNPELSPAGPPSLMLVEGERPRFEVLSPTQVRFTWDRPNARFLPELAAARPPFIYRPSHHMKAFHADFADPDALAAKVAAAGARNWAALHNSADDMYRFDDPALPTLQPWLNTTPRNGQRYVLSRNPFFHRVDAAGRQLPYIDGIDMVIAAGGLIPAKTNRGEVDLQARGLALSDAPVLKKGEARGGYVTRFWRSGYGAEIALWPNLNAADPVWRGVLRDVRLRRALSLAINREALNKSLFFGLATPAAMAALPESPLHDPAHAGAWADHDPAAANALLDEMGLERGPRGVRRLPDGRPMEIVVETAGERREELDALELITEDWADIGVRLIFRPLDRDILRNRVFSGESIMPVWFGWNLGVPVPAAAPTELAPVDQATFAWPKWGQYFQTKGEVGEPVDMPEAQELLELFGQWNLATDDDARADVWRRMLAIHAEQVFGIGLVSGAPQPVAVSARLRNVPEKAIYAWDPGAHFGVYRLDEAFFAP